MRAERCRRSPGRSAKRARHQGGLLLEGAHRGLRLGESRPQGAARQGVARFAQRRLALGGEGLLALDLLAQLGHLRVEHLGPRQAALLAGHGAQRTKPSATRSSAMTPHWMRCTTATPPSWIRRHSSSVRSTSPKSARASAAASSGLRPRASRSRARRARWWRISSWISRSRAAGLRQLERRALPVRARNDMAQPSSAGVSRTRPTAWERASQLAVSLARRRRPLRVSA